MATAWAAGPSSFSETARVLGETGREGKRLTRLSGQTSRHFWRRPDTRGGAAVLRAAVREVAARPEGQCGKLAGAAGMVGVCPRPRATSAAGGLPPAVLLLHASGTDDECR